MQFLQKCECVYNCRTYYKVLYTLLQIEYFMANFELEIWPETTLTNGRASQTGVSGPFPNSRGNMGEQIRISSPIFPLGKGLEI